MAVKKSELYGSIWASCDELRGGMDASQYKDYVLALLFIKYISDKYAGMSYAPIAVPKVASFKDMVDRLTNLIAIFENLVLDFSKNRAEGDDAESVIGENQVGIMEKFKNTYRIPSARATWWGYSWRGCYFITICTARHECIFGKIRDGQMQPSPLGEIVLLEWERSFQIRAELFCDAFLLMPNHLHAIVRIENSDPTTVQTHGRASLRMPKQTLAPTNTGIAHRSPRSISSFVAGFKSSATKRINEFRNTPKIPVWQSRFHDHIIRNEAMENEVVLDLVYNARDIDQKISSLQKIDEWFEAKTRGLNDFQKSKYENACRGG
ncbi:MAG: type I restriction-modification system subunit M N-terminal domain-containing protein [Candidatus Brocadia sp.]|nr:type I restriction-modification system subunit M N-terminal domain-containing protein [Candidatus Brocadia sp.]